MQKLSPLAPPSWYVEVTLNVAALIAQEGGSDWKERDIQNKHWEKDGERTDIKTEK